MEFEPVIGIEVHTQLKTKTKIFCRCKSEFGDEPNKNICPVCMGLPGVLPVLNGKVVELGIKIGLALNCKINLESTFDRKNYFYPDLPKGYQITQFRKPLAEQGWININGRKIRIRRVHIEEESAKILHKGNFALIDYNRAGVPLAEIVTKPDIRSGEEAVEYLTKLQQILRYVGASDADMEKGNMRCEPNISVKPAESTEFGTRREIKNLNSFKAVENGIKYEIESQIKALSSGEKITQATLLWNEKERKTEVMRNKEEASEYRYFPEPDLPNLRLDEEYVRKIKESLPELPEKKKQRLITRYGIREYDAAILITSPLLADFFEQAVKRYNNPQKIANWLISEYLGNFQGKISSDAIADIVKFVEEGKVSRPIGKELLKWVSETGKSPETIIKEKGLEQVKDEGVIKEIIRKVINNNPKEFERLKAGENRLMGFFIGQVMKEIKGKADPRSVKKEIEEIIR